MAKWDNLFEKIYRGDNLFKLTEIRYLPRWVVLCIDTVICLTSVYISYFLISKLRVTPPTFLSLPAKFAVIISVNILFLFFFKTYAGLIRHSTFVDLIKLLFAQASTVLVLALANYFALFAFKSKLFLTPVLLVYFLVSVTMLFLFRMFVKVMFQYFLEYRRFSQKKRILIVGIDNSSVAIARTIMSHPETPYAVQGFITKRSDSRTASLLTKRIYPQSVLINKGKIMSEIEGILLIKEMMSKKELEEWTSLGLENDLLVLTAPVVQELNNKDISREIKSLQIEDLLNRKAISIDNPEVKRRHYALNILVTGGAGSIGSEIVRQVALFKPKLIVVLDQAETPLYEIEVELKEKFPDIRFKFILADISNQRRMEQIFDHYRFSMVYHAAAYKHVPIIEENPHEAILVNIYGSKTLAKLASKYRINRFVMISTDKAVNPTNVMGASKRSAELFVQSLNDLPENTTKFITTRFGNVLGSNGSVIPHFKKQIESGGPVTITHPDIVRYFMTIPEACDLVLQAGTMGSGGEIFVFDMGEPVKIVDLATKMIRLYGLTPNEDIEITYTGLRPGEKLYEELLSDNARTLPTHHEKIMISKDQRIPFSEIDRLTGSLIRAALQRDKMEVVEMLKTIVPEYISQNSEFEVLDNK